MDVDVTAMATVVLRACPVQRRKSLAFRVKRIGAALRPSIMKIKTTWAASGLATSSRRQINLTLNIDARGAGPGVTAEIDRAIPKIVEAVNRSLGLSAYRLT